jgi:hypothetical protein
MTKKFLILSMLLTALGGSALVWASRAHAEGAAAADCPCHCPTCPFKK